MGRIVGVGAEKAPKTFTLKEVECIKKELTEKVDTLTKGNEELVTEKTDLDNKVKELTEKVDTLTKKLKRE